MNLRTGFNRLAIATWIVGSCVIAFIIAEDVDVQPSEYWLLALLAGASAAVLAGLVWLVGWIVRGFWPGGDRPA